MSIVFYTNKSKIVLVIYFNPLQNGFLFLLHLLVLLPDGFNNLNLQRARAWAQTHGVVRYHQLRYC